MGYRFHIKRVMKSKHDACMSVDVRGANISDISIDRSHKKTLKKTWHILIPYRSQTRCDHGTDGS